MTDITPSPTGDLFAQDTFEKNIAAALAVLDLIPDEIRYQRAFVPKDSYGSAPEGASLLKLLLLDTETTGKDPIQDKIIELGMLLVEVDTSTGQAYRILQSYNGLEDPGIPIPPEATKVNGITDAMVQGQRLDDDHVNAMALEADVVLAHNSRFDRAFMERRLPIFKGKPWACSLTQVKWSEEGISSAKLDYIAYRLGFFYAAHRAESDCRALLEALQRPLPETQTLGMKHILDTYRTQDRNVAAVGAPFEAKDALKKRLYSWNAEEKFWHRTVAEEDLQAELDWLRPTVYKGKSFRVAVATVDPFNRFSDRPPERQNVFG